MSEDIEFTYRSLEVSKRVCFVPCTLYSYYLNENSFCSTKKDERGLTERGAYFNLIEHYEGTDWYLERRLRIMAMRSMLHMSPEGFRREILSGTMDPYYSKGMKFKNKLEYVWARYLPSTYHWAFRIFAEYYYYKPGRLYVTDKKRAVIERISKSD
jgi:hypothetical protein